jgi:acyl-[acyl-carrier-protein]-phospholipid O-acyltransferase/long-chain-fatty-acid--[acyl-carrier-protein] ligase
MNPQVHLGYEIYRSLRRGFFKTLLVDYGQPQPIRLKGGMLLALALELAEQIEKEMPRRRIGVVLPPGVAGVLSNLALLLADKSPVNLNFTFGPTNLRYAMDKAGVKEVLSASLMKEKFPQFPWPADFFDIGAWLRTMSRKKIYLIWKALLLLVVPMRWNFKPLNNLKGKDSEAALLFTSGSSGNPKGVVLSHRNLLANCEQIASLNIFSTQDKILANLPLFHSFGFTVATILPLIHRLTMVCVPSPLDLKSSLHAVRSEMVQVILGTPTFLKGYLRKAKKGEDLKSVRYVIAGAEKTPPGFKEKWESFCPCSYLEGYGLTETSPVVSFNLPGLKSPLGSAGKLLPQIEVRTLDVETESTLPRHESGILCFRGPNIFSGYLDSPVETRKVLDKDGWLRTGDLGRVDDHGYLFVEGRLSRFSKIGGEMVPHEKIEREVVEFLGTKQEEDQVCAIVGVEDPAKGEQLVLLTTQSIEANDLREHLFGRGFPNLWIPKIIRQVSDIPTLSTGKMDLRKIRELAEEEMEKG